MITSLGTDSTRVYGDEQSRTRCGHLTEKLTKVPVFCFDQNQLQIGLPIEKKYNLMYFAATS